MRVIDDGLPDRNAVVLKLSGETKVQADRTAVWNALHDAACLRLCIPGCRSIERVSPTRFELSVRVGLGLLAVAISGAGEIEESENPRMLCLKAAGSGGVAGLVGGQLRLTLLDAPLGCRIVYLGLVEPKGVFAAIGSDFLAHQAHRLVDSFVTSFAATVGTPLTGGRPLSRSSATTSQRY